MLTRSRPARLLPWLPVSSSSMSLPLSLSLFSYLEDHIPNSFTLPTNVVRVSQPRSLTNTGRYPQFPALSLPMSPSLSTALALCNHPPMGPHNPALTLTKCHVLHLQITPPDLGYHTAEVRCAGNSCWQTSQIGPVGAFSQVHGQGSPHTRHASCVPSLSQGLVTLLPSRLDKPDVTRAFTLDFHAPLVEGWQMLCGARCMHLGNSYLKRSSGVLNLDACTITRHPIQPATLPRIWLFKLLKSCIFRGEGHWPHVTRAAFEGDVNRDGGGRMQVWQTHGQCATGVS